jgi:type VI secretion system secreted protein Hcp
MAEKWFLKIDGVEGESTDAAHKGEIDVLSWSWGMAQPTSGSGAGASSGKPKFQDFTFVARISKASPKLFLAAATAVHFKWAAVAGVRIASKSKASPFLTYKLSDVLVSSVQHSLDESAVPTESFTVKYGKFEISYRPSSSSGKLGPPVEAGFDLKLNKV